MDKKRTFSEENKKPKLLTQMRHEIQRRKYSPNTERTYCYWAKQYILFHDKQHPKILNQDHINQFLTHLVVSRKVSGSTQAQALNSIVFLYKQVLKIDLGNLDFIRGFKRFKNIPTVLGQSEVAALLSKMEGKPKLMAALLYGSGLRVNECCTLRVQDVDLTLKTITARNTKGLQARVIMIPDRLAQPLEKHLIWRKQLHVNDLYSGAGHVHLPNALGRKYKNAPTSFEWQYLFPSNALSKAKDGDYFMRWYTSPRTIQKAVKNASAQINCNKRITCHT